MASELERHWSVLRSKPATPNEVWVCVCCGIQGFTHLQSSNFFMELIFFLSPDPSLFPASLLPFPLYSCQSCLWVSFGFILITHSFWFLKLGKSLSSAVFPFPLHLRMRRLVRSLKYKEKTESLPRVLDFLISTPISRKCSHWQNGCAKNLCMF